MQLAVKMFHSSAKHVDQQEFLDEARILLEFDHPTVLKVGILGSASR